MSLCMVLDVLRFSWHCQVKKSLLRAGFDDYEKNIRKASLKVISIADYVAQTVEYEIGWRYINKSDLPTVVLRFAIHL